VSDDNTANKNYQKQVERELNEANSPRNRAQAVLDKWWQDRLDEFEENDWVMIGGFRERRSALPSFHRGRHDRDWRTRR
jgi:hypothetical protein